jgi:hypothetical protein
MGHTVEQSPPSRSDAPVAAQSHRWMSSRGRSGEAMSQSSPTRHHFNAGSKRLVRFRVEAAAVLTATAILTHAGLIDHAIAATAYAVDGLAVATQLNFKSASYRDYKCNPSDQFEGLIWCQKTRAEKGRGSRTTVYSLLHSKDGKISYINRSQESASFNPSESELAIERYSRELGESARLLKAPHRSGVANGVIAVWGKITLEPLDQDSIKLLADGKKPRKGLLIDYLRDFTRSAKEGLPVYRIVGGPGLIWAASFDQKGRATLRSAAVDVSGFAPPPDSAPVDAIAAPAHQEEAPAAATVAATAALAPQAELPPVAPVVATAAPAQQAELPPAAPVVATAAPAPQAELPPAAPVVATAAPADQEQLPPAATVIATPAPADLEQLAPAATVVATAGAAQQEELPSELNRRIEKLQADLAISATRVAELESAKSVAERALDKAEQAKLDAQDAKEQVEQARTAEKTASNALIAQLRAEKAAVGPKASRWEIVLYGAVGGVLFFLITSAIGFLIKRGSVSKTQTKPVEVQASAGPAGIAISEAAFARDLEEQVAAINAAKAMLGAARSPVAAG